MSYTIKNIGNRIRQCRLEANLTQEQLAEKIDIAPNYLGQIENGKRGVNLTNLIKIANELNITFDFLMSDITITAIDETNDFKNAWLDLIKNRSPRERELLLRIVRDLSKNLFE